MLHLHIFWIKQCRSLFYVILYILTLLRGNVFIPPFVFTHMFNFSGALRFSVYICVCVQVAVWCHFLSTWRVPLVFLARKICWWWILLVFLYLGTYFAFSFKGWFCWIWCSWLTAPLSVRFLWFPFKAAGLLATTRLPVCMASPPGRTAAPATPWDAHGREGKDQIPTRSNRFSFPWINVPRLVYVCVSFQSLEMVVSEAFTVVLRGEGLSNFSQCHSISMVSPHRPERKKITW